MDVALECELYGQLGSRMPEMFWKKVPSLQYWAVHLTTEITSLEAWL